jgi:uncharacterized protein
MTVDVNPKKEKKVQRTWWRQWSRSWRRYYLSQFPRKKRLHGTFLHRMLGNRLFEPGLWLPTRESVARGMALGIFFGLMPFFGLQIVLSLVFCFLFRVNVSAAVIATFISNPLTTGGIVWVQLLIGQKLAGPVEPGELEAYAGALKFLVTYGKPLLIGSAITSVVGALLAYPLTLWLWTGVTRLSHVKGHGPGKAD